MITFSYQARDASGRIVSGIQDALNEENAVTSLMSRGLMVLSLQRKAMSASARKRKWSVRETGLVRAATGDDDRRRNLIGRGFDSSL